MPAAKKAPAKKKTAKKKEPVASVSVYRDEGGEWRWSAQAANGKTVADSGEGYTNRRWALSQVENRFPGVPVVAD